MYLKKGDTVVVISGSYKGKQGTVLKVLPKTEKVVRTYPKVAPNYHRNFQ